MTTPTGQISFSQIATEFGYPTNKNIGAYRVNQTVGDRTWRLDTDVPLPGQSISFSQLKGKTLNVVVDYSGTQTSTEITAKTNYDSSGVVIGGFKNLPSSAETKKVYHLIRRRIGYGLISGTWDNNTVLLQFIVTGSGDVLGYGGAGGNGGGSDQNGFPGSPGGNALTVSYNSTVVVESGGRIGGGGGGGGGGAYSYFGGPDTRSAGGGGGGGQGYPGGAAGSGGPKPGESIFGGRNEAGNSGTAGTIDAPGSGGVGGGPSNWNPCRGGDGGVFGADGQNGTNSSSDSGLSGGAKGAAGAAISHPGVTVNLTNNGTIYGST